MIDYYETKTQPITKKMVWEAYGKVKANGGSAGIDNQSLEAYAVNLSKNLYKLWNRLTSGCYFPPPVKEVKIPKKDGGTRSLGVPTVNDRIAQQVVKRYLEPKVEGTFHTDSYGYRPGKSAYQALEKATERCGRFSWVIELDIKGFFDNIDHDLMMKAVRYYTKDKWVVMYVERWLKAGMMQESGLIKIEKGTPQGGVVSPLLANIYLHFAFDKWMEKFYPVLPFERYCDDIIVHCRTKREAEFIKSKITERLRQTKLELNESKTHIVYCRNEAHRDKHDKVRFDFLGYTFQPRMCRTKKGLKLMFFPGMSIKAKKSIMDKIRSFHVDRSSMPIQRIAAILNPMLRGWINYYCKFSKWTTEDLWKWLNAKLVQWAKRIRKFPKRRAFKWLRSVYKTQPDLFAHWQITHT
jgi:RNA-directed DNA polymerase